MSIIIRLGKEPFLQFLLIGALIFAVYTLSSEPKRSETESSITLDASTQQWLYGNFARQFRRWPTRNEMDHLLQAHIIAEVKYRHALELGLDQQDSIIRRRMTQKFDFLFGNGAADAVPAEGVAEAWYAEHSADYLNRETVSFEHLYFNPDQRNSAESDAAKALDHLRANTTPVSDHFPFEVVFNDATRLEVRHVLGPQFAEEIFKTSVGEWHGPIRSGLGLHLVSVSSKREGLPPLESVRDEVIRDWRKAESKQILRELESELSSQFDISIDTHALTQFDYSKEAQQ